MAKFSSPFIQKKKRKKINKFHESRYWPRKSIKLREKKRNPPRGTTVDKSVQRNSYKQNGSRNIYISCLLLGACCLACFRYTSVTKYTGKWNVVWALQFSRSGVWISCEAFMTQFQPTTFIMTCKRGVGDHGFHATRTTWNHTSLFVSPFLIDVTSVYPSRSFSLIERIVYRVSKRID